MKNNRLINIAAQNIVSAKKNDNWYSQSILLSRQPEIFETNAIVRWWRWRKRNVKMWITAVNCKISREDSIVRACRSMNWTESGRKIKNMGNNNRKMITEVNNVGLLLLCVPSGMYSSNLAFHIQKTPRIQRKRFLLERNRTMLHNTKRINRNYHLRSIQSINQSINRTYNPLTKSWINQSIHQSFDPIHLYTDHANFTKIGHARQNPNSYKFYRIITIQDIFHMQYQVML